MSEFHPEEQEAHITSTQTFSILLVCREKSSPSPLLLSLKTVLKTHIQFARRIDDDVPAFAYVHQLPANF